MSRKSLANKVLNAQQVLIENDDEAERLSVRRNSKPNSTALSNTPPTRRHSLGLSYLIKIPEPQMKEHISHCIKLNAENKINAKNAFTLEMIDFMNFMVTKKQSEVPDLQAASIALDVCTKIYAYRVDGLYTNVLKMAGGLDKQEKKDENTAVEQELCNSEEVQLKSQSKKKSRNKQKIFTTESALKGSMETYNLLQSVIGSVESCTSDMLYQVMLPIHANSGFYYHQYKDFILDTNDTKVQDNNSSEYTITAIEDDSNLDICPAFSDFAFLNWLDEDEPEAVQSNQQNNETRFQFDLDASIPSAEEHGLKSTNYFDIEEEENNVNLCMRNPEQMDNIVDLRNIIITQIPELGKPSEYSFIQKNLIHWAGPTYWKIKTFGKVLGNSKVVETCHQVALKKKKAIVLEYNNDIKSEVKQRFILCQAAKIQYKTTPKSWKESKKTLPEDVHYNESQLNKLYLYPSIILNHNQNEDESNTLQLPEDENYNYNNENDISDYCPNVDTHNNEIQEENNFNELQTEDKETSENKVAFINENLIAAPKLVEKISVPYAVRAKKIDMRQLKECIWNSITSLGVEEKEDAEKVEEKKAKRVKQSKHFNLVYKSLPLMLSKTNIEALSVPVAFVSLLHLANEKCLKLSSVSDLSDVIIDKD